MSPITREEHPCWVPACDFCGEGDNSEYGGGFHYASEREAREAVEGADWRRLDDGCWQCLTCHENLIAQAAAEAYCGEHGHRWHDFEDGRVCAHCSAREGGRDDG